MKKVLFSLAILVGLSSTTYGQDFGFLGKKNVVSVFSTGNVRIFTALDGMLDGNGTEAYKYSDSKGLRRRPHMFRYDIRVGYRRQLNRSLAVGLEFSYERTRMAYDRYFSGIYNSYSYRGVAPVFNSYQPMVTFSYSNHKNLAPMGFSVTCGIGPKFYKFAENVDYRALDPNSINDVYEVKNIYPDYEKSVIGINAFLELGQRIPVTSFMAIECGLRIHTGFTLARYSDVASGNPNENNYVYEKRHVNSYLMHENLVNVLSFKLGLGFTF